MAPLRLFAVLLSASCAFSLDFPAIFEVDLFFPRDGETYAVTNNFPIIVAVQNAALTLQFGFTFMWQVRNCSDCGMETPPIEWGQIEHDAQYLRFNASAPINDPYILTNDSILDPGSYWFRWDLYYGSVCSSGLLRECSPDTISNGSFPFTIATDAPMPTLTGACPSALGAGIFVTTVECSWYRGPSSTFFCPVTPYRTEPEATPTPTPCNVEIDAALAESLTAQLNLTTRALTSSTTSTAQWSTPTDNAGTLLVPRSIGMVMLLVLGVA